MKYHCCFFIFSANNPEEKQKPSKFCVWITSQPSPKIPNFLILNLHKVAWNHVTMDIMQPDMTDATTDSGEGSEPPLAINYKSPQTYLHTGKGNVPDPFTPFAVKMNTV